MATSGYTPPHKIISRDISFYSFREILMESCVPDQGLQEHPDCNVSGRRCGTLCLGYPPAIGHCTLGCPETSFWIFFNIFQRNRASQMKGFKSIYKYLDGDVSGRRCCALCLGYPPTVVYPRHNPPLRPLDTVYSFENHDL